MLRKKICTTIQFVYKEDSYSFQSSSMKLYSKIEYTLNHTSAFIELFEEICHIFNFMLLNYTIVKILHFQVTSLLLEILSHFIFFSTMQQYEILSYFLFISRNIVGYKCLRGDRVYSILG